MQKYLLPLLFINAVVFAQDFDLGQEGQIYDESIRVSDEQVHAFLNELGLYVDMALGKTEGAFFIFPKDSGYEFLELLLDLDADADLAKAQILQRFPDGTMALHMAAEAGSLNKFELTWEHAKDYMTEEDLLDYAGNSPVHVAIAKKYPLVLGYMYGQEFDFKVKMMSKKFFEQVRENLAGALARKDDINALCEAVAQRDALMLAALFHVGVDVNTENEEGNTAILCEFKLGVESCSDLNWLLLRAAIDWKLENKQGESAAKFFAELMDEQMRAEGDIPLHRAVLNGGKQIVCLLVGTGVGDLYEQDADGNTAAHLAAQKLDLELLDELIDQPDGENLQVKNNAGRDVFDEMLFVFEQYFESQEQEQGQEETVEQQDADEIVFEYEFDGEEYQLESELKYQEEGRAQQGSLKSHQQDQESSGSWLSFSSWFSWGADDKEEL